MGVPEGAGRLRKAIAGALAAADPVGEAPADPVGALAVLQVATVRSTGALVFSFIPPDLRGGCRL